MTASYLFAGKTTIGRCGSKSRNIVNDPTGGRTAASYLHASRPRELCRRGGHSAKEVGALMLYSIPVASIGLISTSTAERDGSGMDCGRGRGGGTIKLSVGTGVSEMQRGLPDASLCE